jgi:acetate kinase
MATNITKIFLVLNSGSSSEKFSLYEGQDEVCSLYFEGVEIDGKKKFICTVSKADGSEEKVDKTWDSLNDAFKEAKAIFEKEGFINESHPLDGILVRTPAAGTYFSKHHIVTDETFDELEKAKLTYPLHVPGAIRGVKNAQEAFPGIPVMTMSDSEALTRDSRRDAEYALPKEIIEEFDLGRWGAHGSSYGYVMGKIKELGILKKKMVICHLGSGCSVTGFIDGEPAYTSMGETPLEGLMSSTRTGSIDPTIGALLGEKLGAAEAIKVMNKVSGLVALAGSSDMREIISGLEEGEENATKAYNMFIDGVAGKIGEFAAKMGGIDAIVFTATIGERSIPVRTSIISKLEFMGFKIKHDATLDKSKGYANVAEEDSKPIYVIPTNEAAYMITKASELVDAIK